MLKIKEHELTPELAFEWLDNHIMLLNKLKESNNSFSVDGTVWCDITSDIHDNELHVTVTMFKQLARLMSLDLDTCLSERRGCIKYEYCLSMRYANYTIFAIASEDEIYELRREWK